MAQTDASEGGAQAAIRQRSSSHLHAHHHHHHGHHHSRSPSPQVPEDPTTSSPATSSLDSGTLASLLGLLINVILCALKLLGGFYLNSASLIADAMHSASDLLADAVTVACWSLSKSTGNGGTEKGSRNDRWKWGRGKFETLGSVLVSLLLLSGGVGIGYHSLLLLLTTVPALQSIFPFSLLPGQHDHDVDHGHTHDLHSEDELDPNAAWFALLGVAVKEWLYQRTARVARAEKSELLMASALHHRSDAMSSVVALVAIIGSSLGYLILDPLGGLMVAGMILKQGIEIGLEGLGDLLDRESDPEFVDSLSKFITSLSGTSTTTAAATDFLPRFTISPSHHHPLRVLKSGSSTRIFLTLSLDDRIASELKAKDLTTAQKNIEKRIIEWGGSGGGGGDDDDDVDVDGKKGTKGKQEESEESAGEIEEVWIRWETVLKTETLAVMVNGGGDDNT